MKNNKEEQSALDASEKIYQILQAEKKRSRYDDKVFKYIFITAIIVCLGYLIQDFSLFYEARNRCETFCYPKKGICLKDSHNKKSYIICNSEDGINGFGGNGKGESSKFAK